MVTIDGVAASGKSSVSSGVARALGIPYVSSGLLYRALTWAALEEGWPLTDATAVLGQVERSAIRLEPRMAGNRVWQGEREITSLLHSSPVDAGVSAVARLPEVRRWVNEQLRALPGPFVAEGRDMGTQVFPEAQHKFYLTASPRIRAQRRAQERPEEVDAIEAALIARDRQDAQQSAPAPDALRIDTGHLTLAQVIDQVVRHISGQLDQRAYVVQGS